MVQRAHGGSRSAEQQVHRPRRHLVDRDDAAVRLHQQQGPAQAQRPQFAVQVAQIGHDPRQQRGIHHGGGGALILPHHRRQGGGGADPSVLHLGPRTVGGGLFMRVIEEAVEEGDGHRLDPRRAEIRQRRIDVLGAQGGQFRAVLVDTPADTAPQMAGHQDGGIGDAVVPLVFPQATADFQRVAEALRRQQADPRALAFQHPVRRDGGTVHEQHAIPQQLRHRAGQHVRRSAQRRQHALAGIGRDRGHLGHHATPGGVRQHQVGESSADIHPDPPGCHKSARCRRAHVRPMPPFAIRRTASINPAQNASSGRPPRRMAPGRASVEPRGDGAERGEARFYPVTRGDRILLGE